MQQFLNSSLLKIIIQSTATPVEPTATSEESSLSQTLFLDLSL